MLERLIQDSKNHSNDFLNCLLERGHLRVSGQCFLDIHETEQLPHPFIHPPIHLSIHLSIRPSTHLPHPSIYQPSMHPPIRPSTNHPSSANERWPRPLTHWNLEGLMVPLWAAHSHSPGVAFKKKSRKLLGGNTFSPSKKMWASRPFNFV